MASRTGSKKKRRFTSHPRANQAKFHKQLTLGRPGCTFCKSLSPKPHLSVVSFKSAFIKYPTCQLHLKLCRTCVSPQTRCCCCGFLRALAISYYCCSAYQCMLLLRILRLFNFTTTVIRSLGGFGVLPWPQCASRGHIGFTLLQRERSE